MPINENLCDTLELSTHTQRSSKPFSGCELQAVNHYTHPGGETMRAYAYAVYAHMCVCVCVCLCTSCVCVCVVLTS